MKLPIEDIRTYFEKTLRSNAEEQGEEIAVRIRPILYTNLGRGRMDVFVNGEFQRVAEYVLRAAERYEHLSPYGPLHTAREGGRPHSISVRGICSDNISF